MWRPDLAVSWRYFGRRVADGVPAVDLFENVSRLNPVGRHGDWPAARKELQGRCKGAPEPGALRAVVEILVHKCSRAALRVQGTSLRRIICLQSWVMSSTGSDVGAHRGFSGTRRIRAQLLTLAGPF
jgi:hypothetical protein